MKPTADNSVALTGALETDYVRNGWISSIGTCTHKFSDQLGLHHWVCEVGENSVPCAIEHDIESRPQSDMCSPDSGRIMEYDVTKHKSKACLRHNKIPSGAGMHILWKYPSKQREAFDEKVTEKLCIHVFFKRFSPQNIQGHHYKRLQLNNYEMENAISFVLVSNTAQIAS